MAKPSIENINITSKIDVPAGGKEWCVDFVCVTSRGTRFTESKWFGPTALGQPGLTKAQLWDAMRAVANAHEATENNPPVKQPADFAGRLDATKGTPTALDPADYPDGETPIASL